jgi:hypothetical protein
MALLGNNIKVGTGMPVSVNLFDGTIKNAPGNVIGIGLNSAQEPVYVVEMELEAPPESATQVGHVQTQHGKQWVLSVYGEEIEARTT